MFPRDIIYELINKRGYEITIKYSEYTANENTIMLENGSNKITFRCKYKTIKDMEEDMKTI